MELNGLLDKKKVSSQLAENETKEGDVTLGQIVMLQICTSEFHIQFKCVNLEGKE